MKCSFFNIPAQQMMYINAGVLTLIISADIADLVQNDYRSYLICWLSSKCASHQ